MSQIFIDNADTQVKFGSHLAKSSSPGVGWSRCSPAREWQNDNLNPKAQGMDSLDLTSNTRRNLSFKDIRDNMCAAVDSDAVRCFSLAKEAS